MLTWLTVLAEWKILPPTVADQSPCYEEHDEQDDNYPNPTRDASAGLVFL
jgi:hypothetical protein